MKTAIKGYATRGADLAILLTVAGFFIAGAKSITDTAVSLAKKGYDKMKPKAGTSEEAEETKDAE